MGLLTKQSNFGIGGKVIAGMNVLGAATLPFQIHSMVVPDKTVRMQAQLQKNTLKALKAKQAVPDPAASFVWGGIMKGLETFNTVTMPLGLAPMFVPDATTRLQAKLQKQQVENPELAKAMGKARELAESGATTAPNTPNTATSKRGVMTANPAANRLQPGQLPPGSMQRASNAANTAT